MHRGELERIASSEHIIRWVHVDRRGNIYYAVEMIRDPVSHVSDFEFHRVAADLSRDERVYLVKGAEKLRVEDVAVDEGGVIYFSLGTYEEAGAPPSGWRSKLIRISGGDVEELAEVRGLIGDIAASANPTLGVFFATLYEDPAVYQYSRGQLRVIARGRGGSMASFLYITLGRDGSLYWVYRETVPPPSTSYWGYLEVARMRPSSLRRGGGPEVLYARYFDDRGVGGWGPSNKLLRVSSMGDVFFNINFWRYSEEEGRSISDHLCWLDPRTGSLTLLFSEVVYLADFTGFEFYFFVVDSQGNLYVSLTKSGKIVKVYRQ